MLRRMVPRRDAVERGDANQLARKSRRECLMCGFLEVQTAMKSLRRCSRQL